MAIINQNASYPVSLPNFCNLGVMLRILVIVDASTLAAAALKADDLGAAWMELLDISVIVQPILLASLILLCAARPLWQRLPYAWGLAAVLALELSVTAAAQAITLPLAPYAAPLGLPKAWFLCLLITGGVLAYFHLRSRALSPALGEARLQALQARIRPHFLFNSINAVLSLIRSDPKRAERALEDMADLFRVLMADNRQLTTLEQEVALCRQYLELEELRLGDRLRVEWHIDNMPTAALVPPLVLQPLLENAVYHGVEPAPEQGEIVVNIYRRGDQTHMVIRNPYWKEGRHHAGNKMAIGNIRERLLLHFDLEASLNTQITEDTYQVHIAMPCVTEKP